MSQTNTPENSSAKRTKYNPYELLAKPLASIPEEPSAVQAPQDPPPPYTSQEPPQLCDVPHCHANSFVGTEYGELCDFHFKIARLKETTDQFRVLQNEATMHYLTKEPGPSPRLVLICKGLGKKLGFCDVDKCMDSCVANMHYGKVCQTHYDMEIQCREEISRGHKRIMLKFMSKKVAPKPEPQSEKMASEGGGLAVTWSQGKSRVKPGDKV